MLKKLVSLCKKEAAKSMPFPLLAGVTFGLVAKILQLNPNYIIRSLKTECKKLAKEHGLPWTDIFLAQYSYDLMQIFGDGKPTACTTGNYTKAGTDKVVFLRYLDWSFPKGIGKFTEINSPNGFYEAGFPGFLGVVTAVGNGWAMGLNQMPSSAYDFGGVPACIFAREFCKLFDAMFEAKLGKTPKQIAHAVHRTLAKNDVRPMTSMMMHFASTRGHAVLEFVPHKDTVVIEFDVDCSVTTANHFISDDNANLNGPREWVGADLVEWFDDTYDRSRFALRHLVEASRKGWSLRDIVNRSKKPILNEYTANITAAELSSSQIVTKAIS